MSCSLKMQERDREQELLARQSTPITRDNGRHCTTLPNYRNPGVLFLPVAFPGFFFNRSGFGF
jgi:hypothetical protein